jgi:curved DNA-binding protein CbpA
MNEVDFSRAAAAYAWDVLEDPKERKEFLTAARDADFDFDKLPEKYKQPVLDAFAELVQ